MLPEQCALFYSSQFNNFGIILFYLNIISIICNIFIVQGQGAKIGTLLVYIH
jgi:hypothetical protein